MSRVSFILYKSFYEPIKTLSKELKGELLDAIFIWQIEGVEPNTNSPIYIAFQFFKNQFSLDNQKYESIVERNKDNGSKGGRPKTQRNPVNPMGLEKPKKAEKEKEKEKEKGNITKSEFEIVFNDFLEMRKKIKKPASDRAIQMIKNKLELLAKDDEPLKIKILEQSILKSYPDVYEVRKDLFSQNGHDGKKEYESPITGKVWYSDEELDKHPNKNMFKLVK